MRSVTGIVPVLVLMAWAGLGAAAASPSRKPVPPAPRTQRAANASDQLWDAWAKSLETHDTGPLRGLLEQVKDLRLKDGHGITPLEFATMAGFTDLTEQFLERGADPDPALGVAAVYDQRIIFSNLLRRGAQVNHADATGITVLMMAAGAPKGTPYVRLLLARGAEVNVASKEGYTALMCAAQSGAHETVFPLLKKKAEVNARNSEGQTALMLAAEAGKTVAVQQLLREGADPNLAARDGSTALSYARQQALLGEKGPLQALGQVGAKAPPRLLLEAILQTDVAAVREALQRGEDPNGPEKDGSPLMFALTLGPGETAQYALVKALVDAGADVNRTAVGAPPLVLACGTRQLEVVKLLLDHKANVNSTASTGYTPLLLAAKEGPAELVQLLLARGADVGRKLPHGETALDLAVEHQQTASVALLKAASSGPSRPARVVTPPKPGEKTLAEAIMANDPEGVRAALARGEDPDPREARSGPYVLTALIVGSLNSWKAATLKPLLEGHASPARADGAGMTPLMSAALYPTAEPARLLLDYGADVHAATNDGQTALLFAAQAENVETMKLLLAKGARPDGVPEKKPLLVEVVRDLRPGHPKPEVLRLLLDSGAKVDGANPKGETPLLVAASCSQLGTVKLLLEKGANPHLATKDGRTALSVALKARKTAVVAVLRKAGATK